MYSGSFERESIIPLDSNSNATQGGQGREHEQSRRSVKPAQGAEQPGGGMAREPGQHNEHKWRVASGSSGAAGGSSGVAGGKRRENRAGSGGSSGRWGVGSGAAGGSGGEAGWSFGRRVGAAGVGAVGGSNTGTQATRVRKGGKYTDHRKRVASGSSRCRERGRRAAGQRAGASGVGREQRAGAVGVGHQVGVADVRAWAAGDAAEYRASDQEAGQRAGAKIRWWRTQRCEELKPGMNGTGGQPQGSCKLTASNSMSGESHRTGPSATRRYLRIGPWCREAKSEQQAESVQNAIFGGQPRAGPSGGWYSHPPDVSGKRRRRMEGCHIRQEPTARD
ncbi:hypothetical protein B0H11DRAFT_1901709 [Mycena galericulata]|nr:hypothetical protein B0H11DRAFT_1901709 [Mycena galericulata]